MSKLLQEHTRVTALTDTQLLSIGVSGKAKQAYALLILDTIDALANPLMAGEKSDSAIPHRKASEQERESGSPASLSGVPVNRDAIASDESENDSGTEALPVCRGSIGEPTPELICEQ